MRSKTPTNLWVARSGEVLVSYSGYVCSLCDPSLSKEEKLGGVGIYLSLTTLQEFRTAFFAVGLLAVDQC